MEYISIIIIIVGFLFSLFQKEATENKKKKSNQPKSIPKQINQAPPIQREVPRPASPSVLQEAIKKRVAESIEYVEKPHPDVEKLRSEKERLERKVKRLEKEKQSMSSRISVVSATNDKNTVFTKENLKDAVIFSEVLAAPRAKNPHRVYKR